MHQAKILADSVSPDGVRLTTFEVTLPRIVLAEFNTHRVFCLAGDSELEFDTPAGQRGEYKRAHKMRLDEFVDKWLYGARRTGAKPKRTTNVDWAEPGQRYSTPEIASRLGMANASNINQMCRRGDLKAVRAENGRTWVVDGAEVRRWRESSPDHTRYDMRTRLSNMRIRQLNEDTGDIQHSYVRNVSVSGTKGVFEVHAGEYMVAGSADHRVLTSEGWTTIGDIKAGDLLVVRKFGKKDDDKLDPLRLKKINGVWRSVWQRQKREELQSSDKVCRRCRKWPGTTIHHIVPVHEDPSRAFDEVNITLLCEQCHTNEHSTQGWQGGTYLYGSCAQVTQVVFRGEEETYDLEIAGKYPNFLANGVVVHNSRNSASSRAIPITKMLKMVEDNPYIPLHWGKNQKGMQAGEELSDHRKGLAQQAWLRARSSALEHTRQLLDLGVHKQTTNRLLEPFMWHTVIVTATEWSNFSHLRNNEMAHPDIRLVAGLMQGLYETEKPHLVRHGSWHLPLIFDEDWDLGRQELSGAGTFSDTFLEETLTNLMVKISCARCARVSYLTHDGKRDLLADLDLYQRLVEPGHLSPLEHAARPMTAEEAWDYATHKTHREQKISGANAFCGNFRGWVRHRKLIPGESDILGYKKKKAGAAP